MTCRVDTLRFDRYDAALTMDYLSPYVPVLVLLLIAGVLCVAIAILASVLGPKRITNIKETAFECGSPSTGDPHSRHSVKFSAAPRVPDSSPPGVRSPPVRMAARARTALARAAAVHKRPVAHEKPIWPGNRS